MDGRTQKLDGQEHANEEVTIRAGFWLLAGTIYRPLASGGVDAHVGYIVDHCRGCGSTQSPEYPEIPEKFSDPPQLSRISSISSLVVGNAALSPPSASTPSASARLP